MKLIVGLGNPGPEYAGTRHNIGFELLDQFAVRLGSIPQPSEFDRLSRARFQGLALDAALGGEKVLLLKPMTFMNLSGQAVQAALAFYRLGIDDLLVILDDIALPCGKLRFRPTGSSGGHNGLKDIERALASPHYSRLRIGIDPPPPRHPQKDYVLGRFTPEQRAILDPALSRGCDALELWIQQGTTTAMNRFNAGPAGA